MGRGRRAQGEVRAGEKERRGGGWRRRGGLVMLRKEVVCVRACVRERNESVCVSLFVCVCGCLKL